ncbi:MAG TPA: sugar phosphate nucleotidyltransferase [Candidatus Paceibacterota bacterium]
MQAVILAAGEGKRLRPLTDDRPKPLIYLNGLPLLEHVLRQIPNAVTDIIMVIGYHEKKIRAHFGSSWNGKPITYVEQEQRMGTWHAVSLCKPYIREKFIMIYGDDIGDKEAYTKGSEYDYCLFVMESEHPERYGVVELNSDGTLKTIIEKPEHPLTNLVNSGAMILSPEALSVEPFLHERLGEYFLTDLLSLMAKEHPVHIVRQSQWITVTYPEDVKRAEMLLNTKGK